jgi:hypothetical protein
LPNCCHQILGFPFHPAIIQTQLYCGCVFRFERRRMMMIHLIAFGVIAAAALVVT